MNHTRAPVVAETLFHRCRRGHSLDLRASGGICETDVLRHEGDLEREPCRGATQRQ